MNQTDVTRNRELLRQFLESRNIACPNRCYNFRDQQTNR